MGAIAALVMVLLLAGCTSDDSPAEDAIPGESSAADGEAGSADADGAGVDAASTDGSEVGDDAEGSGSDEPDGDGSDSDGSAPPPEDPSAELGSILGETGEELAGPELEQYLARRYEAYWQAFDIARRSPTTDPDTVYPELSNLAAGEQLEATNAELRELSEAGHAIREPDSPAVPGLDANSSHRVRIESLEDGVAELVSCLVNDQVHYEVGTGAVVSDTVRTVQTRSTMARADGTWKVIRSEAIGLDTGVAGCWLEDESQYPN